MYYPSTIVLWKIQDTVSPFKVAGCTIPFCLSGNQICFKYNLLPFVIVLSGCIFLQSLQIRVSNEDNEPKCIHYQKTA